MGADWSPDGSRVTFAASKSGHVSALFVVNADGTDLRQITPSGLGAISAQWSPNGDLIAFTSCASSPRTCFRTQAGQLDLGGSPQAWVVRPDGTGLREVTPLSLTPVWSPDSTKLLLNRFSATGQTSLWTVNSDGSQLAKLTDTERLTSYAWGSAPPD